MSGKPAAGASASSEIDVKMSNKAKEAGCAREGGVLSEVAINEIPRKLVYNNKLTQSLRLKNSRIHVDEGGGG